MTPEELQAHLQMARTGHLKPKRQSLPPGTKSIREDTKMSTKLITQMIRTDHRDRSTSLLASPQKVTRTSHHTFCNGIRTVKSIVNGNGRVEVPFQELVTMTEQEILELASMPSSIQVSN